MGDGRSGKPLYELMRQSPGRSVPVQPQAEQSGPREPSPPREGRRPGGPATLSVPLPTVYIAAGIVIALCVASWAGGYTLGSGHGKAEILRTLEPGNLPGMQPGGGADADPDLRVYDPLRPEDRTESTGNADGTTPTVPRRETPPTREGGPIIIAGGRTDIDPRQSGTNYLAVVTLPEVDAESAVAVLARGGVQAMAVPVGGGRYRVVSLGLAVPSGQYRQMGAQRASHERRVGEIGRAWQASGGASDFAQTQWVRHDP